MRSGICKSLKPVVSPERGRGRMVRASRKDENGEKAPPNPEAEERKRLKSLAFSKSLFSQTASKPHFPLSPSKTVLKHHGRDIVKKSQRKNRFLFSFPGLLAPISGGKIGEMKDLGTKNPILYLDFPQGQMKLFGTIIYPENRYLTLHFSKGGKNVACEDYFDNMVVFSEAWWIGRKHENPKEVQLEFPEGVVEGQHSEYDFRGGAGVMHEDKKGVNKPTKDHVVHKSHKVGTEDDQSQDSDPSTGDMEDTVELTPTRHSARTAGKKFVFTEASSGEDSVESESKTSETEEPNVCEKVEVAGSCAFGKTEISSLSVFFNGNKDVVASIDFPGQVQQSSLPESKSNKEPLQKRGPLFQPTISTLFEKMEEKKSKRSVKKSSTPKDSDQKKPKHTVSKWKTDSLKTDKTREEETMIRERKAGVGIMTKKKPTQGIPLQHPASVEPIKVYERKKSKRLPAQAPDSNISTSIASSQVEDDDIEDFSSESEACIPINSETLLDSVGKGTISSIHIKDHQSPCH